MPRVWPCKDRKERHQRVELGFDFVEKFKKSKTSKGKRAFHSPVPQAAAEAFFSCVLRADSYVTDLFLELGRNQ